MSNFSSWRYAVTSAALSTVSINFFYDLFICLFTGQKDASALIDGTYNYKKSRVQQPTQDGDGSEPKKETIQSERHLLPPPQKYISPTPATKGNSGPGRHQDGSWEAFPRVRCKYHCCLHVTLFTHIIAYFRSRLGVKKPVIR